MVEEQVAISGSDFISDEDRLFDDAMYIPSNNRVFFVKYSKTKKPVWYYFDCVTKLFCYYNEDCSIRSMS